MKHFTIGVFSAIALCAGSAYAVGDTTADAVYTGGVGEENREVLELVEDAYDLKLIFTGEKGMYLSDVAVNIMDKDGKSVISSYTDGPYLLAKLDPGTYKVQAYIDGVLKERTITVKKDGKLDTAYIRFPIKDDEPSDGMSTKDVMHTSDLRYYSTDVYYE